MLGFMFNERECSELEYMLKKELDEMLLDLSDSRMDAAIKKVINDRYKVVFNMYSRIGCPKEISKYIRNTKY